MERCYSSPVGSWAEPQRKLNLVYFNVKYDIWWEPFYLFCKELTAQIQCSLNNKAKQHDGTTHLKIGATSKKRRKNGALQNCRILCYAYFVILSNLLSKKYLPLIFQFFYFPPTFFRRHNLPPPVSGVDAPGCMPPKAYLVGDQCLALRIARA